MTFVNGKIYKIKRLGASHHGQIYASVFLGRNLKYQNGYWLFLDSDKELVENSEWMKSDGRGFNNGGTGWTIADIVAEECCDNEPYIFP